jgi:hypothetical protein
MNLRMQPGFTLAILTLLAALGFGGVRFARARAQAAPTPAPEALLQDADEADENPTGGPTVYPDRRYFFLADAWEGRIASRIPPPEGFTRIEAPAGTFALWLRELPLLEGRPPVTLYNGRRKANQEAHFAVVDIDVGDRDLQQSANAVIRMRGEYLYSSALDFGFRLTNGDCVEWGRWGEGFRPRVRKNRVLWEKKAERNFAPESFRAYLDFVFAHAGTGSLARELDPVPDPSKVEIGDVFIQPGSPGHATLVVDVAANPAGERVFLLLQSSTPAQSVYILRNPAHPEAPWYRASSRGDLVTPEWTFRYRDLKRFKPVTCAGEQAPRR